MELKGPIEDSWQKLKIGDIKRPDHKGKNGLYESEVGMERGLAGTWKLVLEGNMKKPLSAEQRDKETLEGPLADNNFEDTCLDGAGLKVNRDIGWMNKKKRMKKRGYYGQIC